MANQEGTCVSADNSPYINNGNCDLCFNAQPTELPPQPPPPMDLSSVSAFAWDSWTSDTHMGSIGEAIFHGPANRIWSDAAGTNNGATANNGNKNCTLSQRAQMFGNGLLNLGIAGVKLAGAAGVEAGTSGVGTALALYGAYSASGNLTTPVFRPPLPG